MQRFLFLRREWFEANPVFKRELRARWRRPAAYLTLFFYAAPLALGMALFYNDQVTSWSVDHSLATVGKDVFEMLIFLQIATWLFIAALTAAPAIAFERERGLLEALQLANLKASRIVWGKLLSLISFQFLLFLVPLPVIAICFLFGGVDPRFFVISIVVIFVTMLCGTAVGLYFSSTRPRPGPALRDALVFLVLWTILAVLSGTRSPWYARWPLFVRQPLAVIELTHPLSGMRFAGHDSFEWPVRNLTEYEISVPSPYLSPMPYSLNPALGPLNKTLSGHRALRYFLVAISALSMLLLLLATRNTARILPEGEFYKRSKKEPKKRSLAEKTQSSPAPPKSENRVASVLFWELPILSRHSFNNPVFGRELRGKLRWRVASPTAWMLRAALLLVPVYLCYRWLSDSDGTVVNLIPLLLLLHLTLLCLYAAVAGAVVFTRERESNTWENLRLSLLTPGQVLHGKIWPIVILLAALSLPLIVAIVCYFGTINFYFGNSLDNEYNSGYNHLTSLQGILIATRATFIIFSTALLVGSVSFFISWLSRSTQVALGLSLAINAAWLLLFYSIATSFSSYDIDSQSFLIWWNPFGALQFLNEYPMIIGYEDSPNPSLVLHLMTFVCPLFLTGFAAFFAFIVAMLMRQKFRDEK